RLSPKELDSCCSARFILIPIKLPMQKSQEETSPLHFALGIIDRESAAAAAAAAAEQQRQQQQSSSSSSSTVAAAKRRRRCAERIAADEECLRADRCCFYLGVAAEHTLQRPRTAQAICGLSPSPGGLLMLNNAAAIAEGRGPQHAIGTRKELAETLWLELMLNKSRTELYSDEGEDID
ncbi:hypothetical protein, conserved, partial [Eimeria tenella]